MSRALVAAVAVLAVLQAACVQALFKEEVGIVDWKQSYVGSVAQSFVGSENTVVATSEGVLAAFENQQGTIAWRKELRSGEKIQHLFQTEDDVVTVSSEGAVRRWETAHGTLVWEQILQSTQPSDIPSSQLPAEVDNLSTAVAIKLREKSSLAVATEDKLILVRLADGSRVWTADLSAGTHVLARDSTHVYAVSTAPSGDSTTVTVTPVSIDDGSTQPKITATLSGAHLCKASWNSVVCTETASGKVQWLTLTSATNTLAFKPFDAAAAAVTSVAKICTSFPVLALASAKGTQYVRFGDSAVTLASVGTGESCTIELHPTTDAGLLICSAIKDSTLTMQYTDLATGKKLDEVAKVSLGKPFSTSAIFDVFFRFQNKSLKSPSVMLRLQDDSLHFWAGDALAWTREEALGSILATEFIDLPAQAHDNSAFSSEGSPVAHFASRVATSLQDIIALVSSAGTSLLASPRDTLNRDLFNQHKIILTVSASGKIIALKSWNGEIVWTGHAVQGQRLQRAQIFTVRTATHKNPLVFVFAQSTEGNSVSFAFNPITGAESSASVPKNILLVSLLPAMEEDHIRPVLFVDTDLKAHIFPGDASLRSALESFALPIHAYAIDVAAGVLRGYRVVPKAGFAVEPTWVISFDPAVERIAAVASKHEERFTTLGEPLGDRSVLYKYLNPNMISIATLSDYERRAAVMSVYIIDTVKGSFIDKVTQDNIRGPVHLAQSENWVVYHARNKKTKQFELGVIELYEAGNKAPEAGFSSFDSAKPIVLRQGYVFPTAVTTMVSTRTEQDITNKQVLMGLVNGGILALPKRTVDARRPMNKKAAEVAVGLAQYHPLIYPDPRALLNYHQSVFRLKNIEVSPTNLESTSLVFANGLDLFFTHVSPSRKFDALNDDFNHPVLLSALAALIVGAYGMAKAFAQKRLKENWK